MRSMWSGDVLAIDHGSLYPALQRLERSAVISGTWETSATNRRARYYRLTAAGRKRLAVEHSKWEQMAAAIARVIAAGLKTIPARLSWLETLTQQANSFLDKYRQRIGIMR